MTPMLLRRTPLAILATHLLLGAQLLAGIAPENVAVVVNGDSEASKTIAAEYVQLRGIPEGNVVSVTGLTNNEKISVDEFRQLLLGPVLQTLAERKRLPQIDLIAYSAEIPTAIDIRGDIGDRKLPKVFTPVASVNGLTFLYQFVMRKDLRYIDLNANQYARHILSDVNDTPWTAEERQQYASVMTKWQQHRQPLRQKNDDEPSSEDEQKNFDAALKEANEALENLLQSHPHSSQLHYNRSCALALRGQADDAVAALERAVAAGWWSAAQAAQDEDLKSLRERDDFQSLLNEMKTSDFDVQPAIGFRSVVGWHPNGAPTADPRAPRYLLSTVLACTTGRGTTVDEALAGLRRTVEADGTHPSGTIYFERNKDVRSTTREWAFHNAARQLQQLGVNAVVEDGVIPQNQPDVAGAVIGTANFDWSKSGSTILAGAIVEHLTSFGGAMASSAGQTPLTEFLKHGAAGASGTVTEPYAIQAKFPSPFVHVHYVSGCTLVEAFYQSVTGPYQLLIVGDPLAQPWRRNFSMANMGVNADTPLSGTVTIQPETESTEEISPAVWELYVDGQVVAAVKAADPLRWDTGRHGNGKHVLTVIARGNDRVQSIARSVLTVTVANAE